MPTSDGPLRQRRIALGLLVLLMLCAGSAEAARVSVEIDGVEGVLHDAAVAGVELSQYGKREVTAAQAHRLYEHAEGEIQSALKPYGYYHVKVSGELKQQGGDYVAALHVDPGEPVKVTKVDIGIDDDARRQRPVEKAIAAFQPKKGRTLDDAAYEKSKATIQAALFAAGYLDAELVTRRVEVTRSSNSAGIDLEWKVGPRYRFGETEFEGGQFPDAFMRRYVPWQQGDFYSQDKLLEFQQRLIDADYFSIAQVAPDIKKAHDGVVPIEVQLAPAKRTIYTGGIFIGTDTGPGVRGGIERRWINRRGHKIKFETLIAQRLKTLGAQYQIPLAGPNDHNLTFGATYRDENTDTSESKTLRLAANDSQLWHRWTRTLGLQFLTGDFKVGEVKGNTTLLYPEVSLSRKSADDPIFPRHGYSIVVAARATPETPLSKTDFAQVTADAKWIHGLGKRGRFIARGSLGATDVGDFDKLPPELRFFAGGDRSIRGYTYQTIGPRNEDGDVVGGRFLAVASAEYEYYFKPNWGIATFVDTGDAFSSIKDYRQKVGVGIGARWRSPVGMVRVDLGFPVRDSHNSGVELHIVIGPDL